MSIVAIDSLSNSQMSLEEMFIGNPEKQKGSIRGVLDQGLLSAEGKESPLWSDSDELYLLW